MSEFKYILVDAETGEHLKNISADEDITIRSKNHQEVVVNVYKTKNERNDFVNKNGNFIFKNNKLHNEITESDEVRLAFISTFVDYDGILRQDSGIPLNKTTLFKLIGTSREIFNEWFLKITDSEIIVEHDGFLMLDKNYYAKGAIKIKNTSHTRLFINAMRNLYESNKGKNLVTLGHVFKILPYINLHNGVVCWRPNNIIDIIPMTAREMLELIGIDTSNILRTLRMLAKHKIDGQPIFSFRTDHIDYGNDKIMVSPLLFYNGKIEDYDRVLSEYVSSLELTTIGNTQ